MLALTLISFNMLHIFSCFEIETKQQHFRNQFLSITEQFHWLFAVMSGKSGFQQIWWQRHVGVLPGLFTGLPGGENKMKMKKTKQKPFKSCDGG